MKKYIWVSGNTFITRYRGVIEGDDVSDMPESLLEYFLASGQVKEVKTTTVEE